MNPREAARVCGSGGLCGERKCCTRFPSHEQPITLRMAKDQDLPMNPGRITGLCGRLRCCLAFEHPVYRSFRDRAPAVGRRVETPQGKAWCAPTRCRRTRSWCASRTASGTSRSP